MYWCWRYITKGYQNTYNLTVCSWLKKADYTKRTISYDILKIFIGQITGAPHFIYTCGVIQASENQDPIVQKCIHTLGVNVSSKMRLIKWLLMVFGCLNKKAELLLSILTAIYGIQPCMRHFIVVISVVLGNRDRN